MVFSRNFRELMGHFVSPGLGLSVLPLHPLAKAWKRVVVVIYKHIRHLEPSCWYAPRVQLPLWGPMTSRQFAGTVRYL